MGKKKLLGRRHWYVNHQGQTEHYHSQPAALVAVDSILASYESEVWNGASSFFLGHHDRETVDTSLFAGRYSPNVLTKFTVSNTFKIDIYVKIKEDWIFKYGSDLLQQSLKADYDCNEGYLAERLDRDYPGFIAKTFDKYKKVDTPNENCLYACSSYQHAYCSIDKENYYITIDNYLGKYQLVKRIDPNVEITRAKSPIKAVDSAIVVTDREKEWIIEYGSDLLQQSLIAGYDCGDRYLQERLDYDYPGFEINPRNYPKVNSPDERCLYACLGYENAYCSSNNSSYYITIDNYLEKYQLVKLIAALLKVSEENSIVQTASNRFSIKIKRYGTLISSSPVALSIVASFSFVFVMSLLWISLFMLIS